MAAFKERSFIVTFMRSFATALLLLPLALPVNAETFHGQVVCSNCWDEADRKTTAYGTPADLKCAARCEKNDVPAALAVDDKTGFKLYPLEDGAFKREGRGWLNYIGKQVEVKGSLRQEKAKSALKVDALKILLSGPGRPSHTP
jgi:hypothetical protein